jgi:hypothetical protein
VSKCAKPFLATLASTLSVLVASCHRPAFPELTFRVGNPSSSTQEPLQLADASSGTSIAPATAAAPDAIGSLDLRSFDASGAGLRAISPPLDAPNLAGRVELTTESVEFEGVRNRPTGSVSAAVADEELQTWNVGGRSDKDYVSSRRGYHPGTRVRVDAIPRLGARFLRSRAGSAFAQRVLAGLRNRGYWPFRNCFEEVARIYPNRGGKTELRLTVGGDGVVRQSRLRKTDLKQHSIALCHAAEARRLRVEPNRLRRVDLDVTVAVWPGDVPLLGLPKAISSSGRENLGLATQTIKSIEPQVIACMQAARQNDPRLWGRLSLSFVIDADGHPSALTEFQSSFGDQQAIDCVAKCLQALEFALPETPGSRLTAAWRLHRPVELPLVLDGATTTPARNEPDSQPKAPISPETDDVPTPTNQEQGPPDDQSSYPGPPQPLQPYGTR